MCGNAWNNATRVGTLCAEATTLEDLYTHLVIATGDNTVEIKDDSPYISFLRFMALDYNEDMDIGDYVGLKRRLIKDFIASLTKAAVNTNDKLVETIIGSIILAICPPRLLNSVNVYDKNQNSSDVLRKARKEAGKLRLYIRLWA